MTWEAIARKDFRDAIRSYRLWGLSALFVVFFTVLAFFFADRVGESVQQQGGQLSSDAFLSILAEVNAFFVPVIAIVVAYAAVAGERDSGTLKLLLSLPHSRLDVVVGKVVGRGGVVVLPVFAGFFVAAAAFLVTPVSFGSGNYVLFAVLTAGLGLVFVAVAVGVSAAAPTARRAMIGTVAVYVLFTLFWNSFSQGIVRLVSDYLDVTGGTLVRLHLLLKVLNPTQAYKSLTTAVVVDDPMSARLQLVGGGGLQGQFTRQAYAGELGETLPFYLSDAFVVLLLVLWLALPPVLGYLTFREADL